MTIQIDAADERVDVHWLRENAAVGEESLKRIPAHYVNAKITDPGVEAWAQRLLEQCVANCRAQNPVVTRGRSLVILGPTGTGKTFEALGAVRALATSGLSVRWRFVTAADLYAELRPRAKVDSEKAFRDYSQTRLLVVDDLGAAKGSEWVEEVNYRLINHRYEHELPTIVTSNLAIRDLAPALGARVTSRLAEMADRVVLAGRDRRMVS